MESDLDEELGYSFGEILPPDTSIVKYVVIAEVVTVAVLLFGGSILLNFLAEL